MQPRREPRKPAEDLLQDKLLVYQQIFEFASDGIALIDLQGRYLHQNASHRELLGYADDDLRDQTPAVHLGAAQFGRIVESLAATGFFRGEVESRRKDGRQVFVELSAFAIRNGEGDPVAYVGIKRDIGLQRRDRDALQHRYELLQVLYKLVDTVNTSRDLQEIYRASLQAIEGGVRAEKSSILLFDPDGVMRFKAWRGLSDGYRAAVEGHSPWSPSETRPKPIAIEDVMTEPSLGALRSVVLDEGIRSLAFIPLMTQGRLLGKFMVYFSSPHHYQDEELQLCQSIAHHVAFVIARTQAESQIQSLNEALSKKIGEYEQAVAELKRSQQELQSKVTDLEQFEEVVVGRELKMISLEKEVERLQKELARFKSEDHPAEPSHS